MVGYGVNHYGGIEQATILMYWGTNNHGGGTDHQNGSGQNHQDGLMYSGTLYNEAGWFSRQKPINQCLVYCTSTYMHMGPKK